jgi:integrase
MVTEQQAVLPSPEDVFTGTLKSFHATHVREIWAKALARRIDDPANAITLARTLLESVCKVILDGTGTRYPHSVSLPRLYEMTAKALIVSPSPTTEEVFNKMLQACMDVVWGVGMLRNFLSDSHGRGMAGAGSTPDWRHAELAINLAGTIATYLLAIWENRQPTLPELIDKHLPSVKPGSNKHFTLKRIRNSSLAAKVAAWLTVDDIVEYCEGRALEKTSPATIRQDLIYVNGALKRASISMDLYRQSKPTLVARGLIGSSKKRLRRPMPEEIARLLDYCRQLDLVSRRLNMTPMVEFAIASGRQMSEITLMKWADLDRNKHTCVLAGEEFRLLGRAWDIVIAQPEVKDRIFPYNPRSTSAAFQQAKKKLKLHALTFNDFRLEAICRLLEAGYGIHEVSNATGQKDHNYIAEVKLKLIDRPRSTPP